MANPPYDPVKDFSAIAVFAYSSTSIVVNPSLPVRTLDELIAYAKANPGKLSYGSAGTGSITHVAGEYFKQLAGGLNGRGTGRRARFKFLGNGPFLAGAGRRT
jgi:tripartite-type tricarboxylate transporter receptor subunit TctC